MPEPAPRHVIPGVLHAEPQTTTPAPSYVSIVKFSEAETHLMREKLDAWYCRASTPDERLMLSSIIEKFDADACVIARCKRRDTKNHAAYRSAGT